MRMRFALLGDHPDGLGFARALVDSGRHELVAFTAPVPFEVGRRRPAASLSSAVARADALTEQPPAAVVTSLELKDIHRRPWDLEEILADPTIDAIIVAGRLSDRPALLRRALQSERHVVCVHPADRAPEIGYEAGMIRQDVHCVLLPLLAEGLHPAVRRLAEFIGRSGEVNAARRTAAEASVSERHDTLAVVGAFRLLKVERAGRPQSDVVMNLGDGVEKPCFAGWDLLRRLGGEIAEVSAYAAAEELETGQPVLLAGRFSRGGLFQATLLPDAPEDRWQITVIGECGRAELLFPQGWEGPAQLGWRDPDGAYHEEYWDRWDPWPPLIEAFESQVGEASAVRNPQSAIPIAWQDEVRALELDDAARRSLQKGRTSPLEYPEASEEVGFKGTMTLVGCSMLWLVLLLLIVSRWVPVVGWLIVPLLAVFLGLQFLRYAVAEKKDTGAPKG
jgi:predicted dehydrogenase